MEGMDNLMTFQTWGGNEYIFCPNTCLVFAKEPFVSYNNGSTDFCDYNLSLKERISLWQEKYGIFLSPSESELIAPTEKDIDEYLMRFGFNELLLEVTQDCNMRCTYCVFGGTYSGKRTHSKLRMSWGVAKRAIDQYLHSVEKGRMCNPKRKPVIAFYGGEPLLNYPLIEQCTKYIRKVYQDEVFLTITTNGTLLTDDISKFLVENGFTIVISLDGPKDEHDRNRVFSTGKGTFEIVVNNIRRLQELSNKPIFVNCVYDPQTDLERVANFFSEHRDWIILGVSPVNPNKTSYYQRFSKADYERLEYQLRRLKQLYLERAAKNTNVDVSYLSVLVGKPAAMVFLRPILDRYKPSWLPYTGACVPGDKIFVDIQGFLHVCEKVGGCFPIGNVYTWIDLTKIVEWIKKYQLQILDNCKNCPVRYVCSFCYGNFLDDGEFINAKDICKKMVDLFRNTMEYAYSILEVNPEWFEIFSTKYYGAIKEMVVELK